MPPVLLQCNTTVRVAVSDSVRRGGGDVSVQDMERAPDHGEVIR